MTNSTLQSRPIEGRKKWKVIFWILAVLTFLDFVALPFKNVIDVDDFVGLAIGALLLVPYYGYAYQVAIGWKLLWQLAFVSNLFSLGYVFKDHFVENVIDDFVLSEFTALLMIVVLTCLLLIPCFRYAFQSTHLWTTDD